MPRRRRSSSLKTKRHQSGARRYKPSWATETKRRVNRRYTPYRRVQSKLFEPAPTVIRSGTRRTVVRGTVYKKKAALTRQTEAKNERVLSSLRQQNPTRCLIRKQGKKTMMRQLAAQHQKRGGSRSLNLWRQARRHFLQEC